jgi:hypothetical protein
MQLSQHELRNGTWARGTNITIFDRAAVDARSRRYSGTRVLSSKAVQAIQLDEKKVAEYSIDVSPKILDLRQC